MTQRIKSGDLYWEHDDECSAKNPCAECEKMAADELYDYGVDIEAEDEDGGTWRSFAPIKR